ncbi:MAG: HAMP domain-containing sensor histidine kinase [Lachnospiraceae bacterium]|nr:HAMP domain-containing sensor histidine kinase [Lachnospiraceae bacterium]
MMRTADDTNNSERKHMMRASYMKQSLRVKFTLLFILVMVAATGISILLNLYFLEDYYLENKKDAVAEEISEINRVMNQYQFTGSSRDMSDELTSELSQILTECWSKYNISAVLVGTDDVVLFRSSSEMVDLQRRLGQYIFSDNMDIRKIYGNSSYQIVIMKESHSNARYMDAFGFLESGCGFLLSTPVESIRESASISNKFFVLTGVSVALFAGMYIFFIMKRMTRPILELTTIANRMAKQDFHVRYQGDSQDEVGLLGNSMNYLASELEKTITELKAANEQLQKDIEEKIQIDDMRKEFLSNVSHELKTPIAIIQGYAEGLHDCVNDDPESREFYCDVIMDEAAKMNQMVQKLLNLNHLEFGSHTCEITEFDLSEMIHGMVDSTRILLQQKEGTMEYRENDRSMMVLGDEFMIEEVLKNYISNACNHLDGERKVLISADDSRDNRIRVSVYNTGEHIPRESLDKVWIKFYKVDKARTREYGGSGIGLSIVKAIMDQHGCPYGVENTTGGVVFWFELNRAPADAGADPGNNL